MLEWGKGELDHDACGDSRAPPSTASGERCESMADNRSLSSETRLTRGSLRRNEEAVGKLGMGKGGT
jgi:hypothetical protein